MDILYQCNDKYAPYCGISITSLFENNKNAYKIRIYILDDEIAEANKSKFYKLAKQYNREIVFLDTSGLSDYLDELGVARYRNSHTTNFKMFVSKLVSDDVERLLYIDSDTIVNNSLSDLFNMDLNNKPIAMVQDSLVFEHKYEININQNQPYYNAGVILFDIKRWKELECEDKILNHIKNIRANYPLPDQDLLNVCINKDIFALEPKYNLQPIYFMFKTKDYYNTFKNPCFYDEKVLEESKLDGKIYHMFRVMGLWPWNKNNNHPFNNLFDKYMYLSPWNDYQKQDVKISFVFKLEKLLYKIMPKCIFIKLLKLSITK